MIDPLIIKARRRVELARAYMQPRTRFPKLRARDLIESVEQLSAALARSQQAYVQVAALTWTIEAYQEICSLLEQLGIKAWQGMDDGNRWRWSWGDQEGIEDSLGGAIIAALIASAASKAPEAARRDEPVAPTFTCPGCGRETNVVFNWSSCPACAGRE